MMSASPVPTGAELDRRVQARVGQADVIDDSDQLAGGNLAADYIFDLIAQARGFFDAGAGLRAHMQLELAAINRREEVLPQPRIKQASDNIQKATIASRNATRNCRHNRRTPWYRSRIRSKACSKAIWKRTKGL